MHLSHTALYWLITTSVSPRGTTLDLVESLVRSHCRGGLTPVCLGTPVTSHALLPQPNR